MILKKSSECFLKLGFKSVTMDDIANKMAISKKTIYKYFKNKEELIDETVTFLHESMMTGINCICDNQYNAIQENFEIKKMFRDLLKHSDDSPMYQLQKYYPKTYQRIIKKEFIMFKDCIMNNIRKGIDDGLYRSDIDPDVITRFYFSLVMSIHDADLFQYKRNTKDKLEIDILEYHTRAISTPKGIEILEEQINLFKNNAWKILVSYYSY